MNEADMMIAQRYYAVIAEQGGADPELDILIYEPASDVDTGDQYVLGEGINNVPLE